MCSGSWHKEPQCETKSPVQRKTIFTPSMVKGIEEGPDKPGCKTALFYNGREFSILETVRGNWVQAFGATTSGIVYVDKRYLWLVNGCLRYHRSLSIPLYPKLVPILPRASEVENEITSKKGVERELHAEWDYACVNRALSLRILHNLLVPSPSTKSDSGFWE